MTGASFLPFKPSHLDCLQIKHVSRLLNNWYTSSAYRNMRNSVLERVVNIQHTYCTISIDSDVTRHRYPRFVRNVTLVLRPNKYLCPKWSPENESKYGNLGTIFSGARAKGAKSHQIWQVSETKNSDRGVTGHTLVRIIRNSTVPEVNPLGFIYG